MGRILLTGMALGFGIAIPLVLLFLGIRWYDDQRIQAESLSKQATATAQATVAYQATATAAALPHCTEPSKLTITNLQIVARPSEKPNDPGVPGFRRSYYVSFSKKNTCNYPLFYQLDYTIFNNGTVLDTYSSGISWITGDIELSNNDIKVLDYTSNNEIKIDVKINPVIMLSCESSGNQRTNPTDSRLLDCNKQGLPL